MGALFMPKQIGGIWGLKVVAVKQSETRLII